MVVPFTIACGTCFFCQKGLFSLCDTSNPNAEVARKAMGHATAGLFGYSHMMGGYAGGQAEYLRVPFADVGPLKIPPGLPDDQVLFLSDIFPTGYMAAEDAIAIRVRIGIRIRPPSDSMRSNALNGAKLAAKAALAC